MKKLITLFVILCFAFTSFGQVTGVNFSIDFDYSVGDTYFYDCRIHIEEGSATTIAQRIQFNSQYSFVTPADVAIEVVESYLPLLNNANYTGSLPMDWQLGTVVYSPAVLPNNNLHSITPFISTQTSHYNDLFAGDVLPIFRIAAIGENLCPLDIRIYENGIDPSSSDLPTGTDFSNGFRLGGFDQLYIGNLSTNDFADDINCKDYIALSCDAITEALCDVDILNGYMGTITTEESTGNQPNPLCPDGGAPFNITWFAFIAPEGDYSMTFTPFSCTTDMNGFTGVQMGIYSNCTFSEAVFCAPDCSTAPVSISSSFLEAGQTYYFFIDGCGESICDYTITIEGDYTSDCGEQCGDLAPSDDPYILGTAFIDENENGEFDSDESPLRNVLVSITPGNFSILTDDDGKYQMNIPEGEYTISAKVNEGNWIQDELFINNISITDPCKDGLDFAFMPSSTPLHMASLTMSNTIARCDWETTFTITVENTGTEPFEGIVQFTFDDETTLFSSDIPNLQVNGNSVSGQIGPLQPFVPANFKVTVKMPNGSASLPLLDFDTKLFTLSNELIKEYGYAQQLLCSYDPNDKRTFPDREGEDNLTLMDEDIEYIIRFQNNGNDTAFQVKIIDPLDPSIDPSTIRVISSSHDVETCIEGTDLIFLFEDIFLVDSTTNFDASQGYVTFRCNIKEGLAEMTPVHNQADIIFDTNAPIVTNQTINTMVTVLCTDKSTTIEATICDGDDYNGITEAGVYTEHIELPFGCDSVVTLILEVDEITFSQQNFTICAGSILIIGGMNYTIVEDISIQDTLINTNGCISNIATLEIEAITDILGELTELTNCVGESIPLPSDLMGTWISNDESILTLDDDGNISFVGSGTTSLTFTDDLHGCMDDLPVTVLPISDPMCLVGTEDNPLSNLIRLYPNPAIESITIETEIDWNSIKIVDIQGKAVHVYNQVKAGKLDVDVTSYIPGVYMMIFKDGENSMTRRFVVK